MNSADEHSTDMAIAKQAAEWFIDNQEGTWSNVRRAEFLAWLKASPVHVREYLAIANAAQELMAAAQKSECEIDELLVDIASESDEAVVSLHGGNKTRRRCENEKPNRAKKERRRWRWAVAASAAFICVATLVAVLQQNLSWLRGYETYRTAHAEQRSWTLPDGSVMHLNSDSTVRVSFSRDQRRIDLERGQAYFQVFKDAGRNFLVKSGKVETVAG